MAEFVYIFSSIPLPRIDNTGIYQGYGADDVMVDNSSAGGVTASRLSGSEFKLLTRSDAFSGVYVSGSNAIGSGGGGVTPNSSMASVSVDVPPHSPTPPLQRRLAKSFSVAPSSSQLKGHYIRKQFIFFFSIAHTHTYIRFFF